MNYGSHPKDMTASLNFCEKALSANQYMHGKQLTSMDLDHFEKLKTNANMISPLTHPHTFSWYCVIDKFSD